ncbi:MAG TPA: SCO family protein, partial [Pirellulales bacterium]|nr:SCO family protein [Pirellulales bacterium]
MQNAKWVRCCACWLFASGLLLVIASTAFAQRPFAVAEYHPPADQGQVAAMVSQIGIDQHLGEQLPLGLPLRDEKGQQVALGKFFHNKPVVLLLVYYRCPMLCTQVLNGFLKSSQAVKYTIGRDYEVVTVSFDPRETAELAAEKKVAYVRAYRREGAEVGWHFLTGSEES